MHNICKRLLITLIVCEDERLLLAGALGAPMSFFK